MYKACIKPALLQLWNWAWGVFSIGNKIFYIVKDFFYQMFHRPPQIVSLEQTLRYIIDNNCSVARFGDAEVKYIMGRPIWYQRDIPYLRTRMQDILKNHDPQMIVCVPGPLASLVEYREHDVQFWREHFSYSRPYWYGNMDKTKLYYEAFISRFYLPYKDKSKAPLYVNLWKQIWDKRDVIIVEGEKSRLGVGNDLFGNVNSIKRILAPNLNAFDFYDDLLNEVKTYSTEHLVLIAMGPTAKVLVQDLCHVGYQAIDVGHIDIEYEWMLMGVSDKVPVKNKFVNEAGAGKGVGECVDEEYLSQIVKVFDHNA